MKKIVRQTPLLSELESSFKAMIVKNVIFERNLTKTIVECILKEKTIIWEKKTESKHLEIIKIKLAWYWHKNS
jgi:hypothetical protein